MFEFGVFIFELIADTLTVFSHAAKYLSKIKIRYRIWRSEKSEKKNIIYWRTFTQIERASTLLNGFQFPANDADGSVLQECQHIIWEANMKMSIQSYILIAKCSSDDNKRLHAIRQLSQTGDLKTISILDTLLKNPNNSVKLNNTINKAIKEIDKRINNQEGTYQHTADKPL